MGSLRLIKRGLKTIMGRQLIYRPSRTSISKCRCLPSSHRIGNLWYHVAVRQHGERAMSNSKNLVEIDPEKLGGTPVFYGTRVPIQNLFDSLETGESVDQFLEQFPTVTREQALAVLEESKERLLVGYESAA